MSLAGYRAALIREYPQGESNPCYLTENQAYCLYTMRAYGH